jgi:hypothetical protein
MRVANPGGGALKLTLSNDPSLDMSAPPSPFDPDFPADELLQPAAVQPDADDAGDPHSMLRQMLGPAEELDAVDVGMDEDMQPLLDFVAALVPAPAPAPITPAEHYAALVRRPCANHPLTPEQMQSLVDAFGDSVRDLEVLHTIPLAARRCVVRCTINTTVDWRRDMMGILAVVGQAVGAQVDIITTYADRRLLPKDMSYAQKEEVARILTLANSDHADALCIEVYAHSPIEDWPSRASVDHLLRIARIMRGVGNCVRDLQFIWGIASMTTQGGAYFKPASVETDALLRDILLYADDMPIRAKFAWQAVSENWPLVHDVQLVSLRPADRGVRDFLLKEFVGHNARLDRAMQRRDVASRASIRAVRDHATDTPALQCAVCMDHARAVVLRPCNHVCLCARCYLALKKSKCPVCNAVVDTADPVLLP